MQIKKGKVIKVIFNNPSNGYTVARFRSDDESFTITGSFHSLDENFIYELEGDFVVHPKYGQQFAVKSYKEALPDDSEGIRALLSSGTIRGVGPKTADLIIKKFGDKSLEIIAEDPQQLLSVKGIGVKLLDKIVTSYQEHREFADISLALRDYGIELSQAVRIYRLYGTDSVKVVTENPYKLIAEVYGITFRKADEIAGRAGVDPNSEFRIASGIRYALSEYAGSGSTYVPLSVLTEKTISLLDVTTEQIEDCYKSMSILDEIKIDSVEGIDVAYLYNYYRSEERVAYNLSRLMNGSVPPMPVDIDNLISDAETRGHIKISNEQRMAIRTALLENVCIITGGPGTGKTTIINIIVSALSRMDISFALAAPTGRAAKRMTETSGYPAQTIHRLLEYVFTDDSLYMEFGRNSENRLEQEVIIVDEASMIDIVLMDGLLEAIETGAKLVIVGDADQLPSVGAGNVLRDMIKSEYIPTVRLKEIFRQAEESKIIVNAHMINSGEYPAKGGFNDDFFFMHRNNDEEILTTITELVGGRLSAYYDFIKDPSDVQVLTPTKKGMLGTNNLNPVLQEVLNPVEQGKNELKYGSRTFREGDKVMQIKNNYQMTWRDESFQTGMGIFNGDLGIIEVIDNDSNKVYVRFDDKVVTYELPDLEELELAYAVTVHKSQGCEFPAVIIPMSNFPPMLMTRNLLYTGVTRGAKLVVIVGYEYRMQQMIDNNRIDERYTGLAARLRARDYGLF